jgi:hypothetical protein
MLVRIFADGLDVDVDAPLGGALTAITVGDASTSRAPANTRPRRYKINDKRSSPSSRKSILR